MFSYLLKAYGLSPELYDISSFGTGLINRTWKITGQDQQFILQQINKQVFQCPQDIADNLEILAGYLAKVFPDYLFVAPIRTLDGRPLVKTKSGEYYRMSPFIKKSHTIDSIENEIQAYEAAKQFGKFTNLLENIDIRLLKYPLSDFHNLLLRYDQFNEACANANFERLNTAAAAIKEVKRHGNIVEIYRQLITSGLLQIRVTHHDTKINNVLFDEDGYGLCVIDLDTVMPGFYISDVGDMLRTYLSPVSEEEKDFEKIVIRDEFFSAIYRGYMEEMGNVLTDKEKSYFIFAGKFMIYMQALRFLTDFLNADIYYQVKYTGHNLVRAENQLVFLNRYMEKESNFQEMIDHERVLFGINNVRTP